MNSRAILLAALFLPFSVQTHAADWIGPAGLQSNWNIPGNWSSSIVPAHPELAVIDNSGVALIDSSMTLNPGAISLGRTGGTSGSVLMSGGSLTLSNTDLRIGGTNSTANPGGIGRFELSGGTITMNAGNLNVGFGATSVGTFTVSGGALNIFSANIFAVANRGTGTVDQSGGIIYVRGMNSNFAEAQVNLGRNTATAPAEAVTSSYTLRGGTLAVPNLRYGNAVGNAGISTSTFRLQDSGELIVSNIAVINTNATNVFEFNGGILRAQSIGLPLNNAGGTLAPSTPLFTGAGTFAQLVVDAIGTTTFTGDHDYIQGPSASLALDLRDSLTYDILDVGATGDGTVTLGGFVDVNPLTGFDPGLGSFFDVVRADDITFNALVTGQTASGFTFEPSIVLGGDGREMLRLTVVPEPGSAGLLLAAGIAFAGRRRRAAQA